MSVWECRRWLSSVRPAARLRQWSAVCCVWTWPPLTSTRHALFMCIDWRLMHPYALTSPGKMQPSATACHQDNPGSSWGRSPGPASEDLSRLSRARHWTRLSQGRGKPSPLEHTEKLSSLLHHMGHLCVLLCRSRACAGRTGCTRRWRFCSTGRWPTMQHRLLSCCWRTCTRDATPWMSHPAVSHSMTRPAAAAAGGGGQQPRGARAVPPATSCSSTCTAASPAARSLPACSSTQPLSALHALPTFLSHTV